jgi:hypothetical protein
MARSHHDGTKSQRCTFDGGIDDRATSSPELVNVFDHDDAGLNRDTKERQHTDTGRHAQIISGYQKSTL